MRWFKWLVDQLRASRLARRTGVRRVGRDTFVVHLAGRRYFLNAEMMGKGPVDHVIYPTSFRDTTEEADPLRARPVSADVRDALLRSLKQYSQESGLRFGVHVQASGAPDSL